MKSSLLCLTRDDPACTHSHQVEQFCAGGAKFIQLRSKTLPMNKILKDAGDAVGIARKNHSILIINDFISLARDLDADGVHLGSGDEGIQKARSVLSPGKIIGKTVHSISEAEEALHEKPDYVGLGPFRKSITKKRLYPTLSIDAFKDIISLLSPMPVYLIGGLGLNDFPLLELVGARGLAMCQSLFEGETISHQVGLMLERSQHSLTSQTI